jgi:hypothetical protein
MTTPITAGAPVRLEEVTRRVIVDYLGTRAHEKFLLVTDTSVAPELVDSLMDAAHAVGTDPAHMQISTRANRRG